MKNKRLVELLQSTNLDTASPTSHKRNLEKALLERQPIYPLNLNYMSLSKKIIPVGVALVLTFTVLLTQTHVFTPSKVSAARQVVEQALSNIQNFDESEEAKLKKDLLEEAKKSKDLQIIGTEGEYQKILFSENANEIVILINPEESRHDAIKFLFLSYPPERFVEGRIEEDRLYLVREFGPTAPPGEFEAPWVEGLTAELPAGSSKYVQGDRLVDPDLESGLIQRLIAYQNQKFIEELHLLDETTPPHPSISLAEWQNYVHRLKNFIQSSNVIFRGMAGPGYDSENGVLDKNFAIGYYALGQQSENNGKAQQMVEKTITKLNALSSAEANWKREFLQVAKTLKSLNYLNDYEDYEDAGKNYQKLSFNFKNIVYTIALDPNGTSEKAVRFWYSDPNGGGFLPLTQERYEEIKHNE